MVARHLETLGYQVIVADPTFAPTWSERNRRVTLAERPVFAAQVAPFAISSRPFFTAPTNSSWSAVLWSA